MLLWNYLNVINMNVMLFCVILFICVFLSRFVMDLILMDSVWLLISLVKLWFEYCGVEWVMR